MKQALTWEVLLAAYAHGYFPMAQSRDDPEIYWFCPEQRGILPLESFHVPRRLAKFLKQQPFTITVNQAFPEVIAGCAERKEGTWINDAIVRLYGELAQRGFAHNIECWRDGQLVGGLYGVALGGAFFGESMFSRQSGASKAALAHLAQLLKNSGYRLLDTQYVNEHLKQFGVVEIPRQEYMRLLEEALAVTPLGCF